MSLQRIALTLFIVSILLVGIIFAKSILIPLAISFLFAYLLYPVVWRIERYGLHRMIAILTVILISLIIIASVVFFFSVQISNIHINLDGMKDKMIQESSSTHSFLEDKLGINLNTIGFYFDTTIKNIVSSLQSQFGSIFTTTATTLFQIFILPVFTFFILFYRTKVAYFIFRLIGRNKKRKAVKILREVSTITPRYLGGLLGVVVILSVLNTLGLTIIGVPHALVLGVGAAILNLIPYFGTLIGALIPLVYVLVSVANPINMASKVVLIFMIIQFLENNIITPNVVGGNVKLNPLTIIIGLLFGNLIWGVAGMLIIIPYIAILKIVMRNIESLKPFAYLLSNKGMDKYRVNFGGLRILKRNLKGNGKGKVKKSAGK